MYEVGCRAQVYDLNSLFVHGIQEQSWLINLEIPVCINRIQNLWTTDSDVGISSDHQQNPKFIFKPGELMQIHLIRLWKVKAYFTFSG